MKHSLKYIVISVVLVVAIFVQSLQPVARVSAQASNAPEMTGFISSLAKFEQQIKQFQASAPGMTNIALPQAQGVWECQQLFLPVILKSSGTLAATSSSPTTLEPAATVALGPDIAIISPDDGWTISGMLYFAVQAPPSAKVSSVTFKAGSTSLGTDSTPADGFKVFLNAKTFPAGALQLSATATSPCGQTTKTITVNNVPNPPQSATIGQQGGVLASQIGSIISFPPGAVPNGTTITVTEKTQAQTTAEHGIDWNAIGVTFLGAQAIQSTAAFSQSLMVSSAGFGNRVQPGQAVVNYNIVPDSDGDGVDELVVVNTASVAPNNDVISDPVPQIQLGPVQTLSGTTTSSMRSSQAGIGGPPGTIVEIRATGFNPYSILGNVAIFRSVTTGQTVLAPGTIEYNADGSGQTFGFRVWYQLQDGTWTRNPQNMLNVEKVLPVVATRLSDPRRPALVDSVWAAVQPRTF